MMERPAKFTGIDCTLDDECLSFVVVSEIRQRQAQFNRTSLDLGGNDDL